MPPTYSLAFSDQALTDFRSIFVFLRGSYHAFGDTMPEAGRKARLRIKEILRATDSLRSLPHRGMRREDLLPNLRCWHTQRAIFYFVVDDESLEIKIIAVFFGGQDHFSKIVQRLSYTA